MLSARGYCGVAMVRNALNPLNRRLEHRLTGTTTTTAQRLLQECLALARRGPNITSQQSHAFVYLDCLCLRGLGLWDLSLRYPTYGQSSVSDQASGPPLTRILSVGADTKKHAELQVNRCGASI